MIIRFRTTSGSEYTYDDETKMFDRYLQGPKAAPLRADAGRCAREPEIIPGRPVAFHCDPLAPGMSHRLVVTTPVTEIYDEEKAA
jgi:hypothetical protein